MAAEFMQDVSENLLKLVFLSWLCDTSSHCWSSHLIRFERASFKLLRLPQAINQASRRRVTGYQLTLTPRLAITPFRSLSSTSLL
jgi:hypothetical protein